MGDAMRVMLRPLCALVVAAVMSTVLVAQQATGAIAGSIFDPNGNVITGYIGALLVLKNQGTGAELRTEIKTDGSFALEKILRPAVAIPENLPTGKIIAQMRDNKTQILIVRDGDAHRATFAAPAAYLRQLPAPVAADCLNYGFHVERDASDVGVLLTKNGAPVMRAMTGPRYGRIWNGDVIDAIAPGHPGDWLIVAGDVADEFAIDLERVDGKALEIGEARVTGAEVVHRELHARVAQAMENARSALGVIHDQGLGDLELHQRRVHARP